MATSVPVMKDARGRQEGDEVGDFLRFTGATLHGRLADGIEQFPFGRVGIDRPWRDGVDADARGPEFGRPRTGQRGQGGFGGAVGGGCGLTDGAGPAATLMITPYPRATIFGASTDTSR